MAGGCSSFESCPGCGSSRKRRRQWAAHPLARTESCPEPYSSNSAAARPPPVFSRSVSAPINLDVPAALLSLGRSEIPSPASPNMISAPVEFRRPPASPLLVAPFPPPPLIPVADASGEDGGKKAECGCGQGGESEKEKTNTKCSAEQEEGGSGGDVEVLRFSFACKCGEVREVVYKRKVV